MASAGTVCTSDRADSHLMQDNGGSGAYSELPGACPFRRPWETCALDDPARAAKIGRRRYGGSCQQQFDAVELRRIMVGRTLLLIGDSVNLQFFVSLACQLHAQIASSITHHSLDFAPVALLKKRCHGERKCHYQYGCVHFDNGFRICHCFIWEVNWKILKHCVKRFNQTTAMPGTPYRRPIVVYGSVGVHYRESKRLYSKGTAPLVVQEAETVIRTLRPRVAHLIWREVTAQHFGFRGGHFNFPTMEDYNTWKANATCASNHTLSEMRQYHTWNNVTNPILARAGVPILAVWQSTALAWDAHVGFGDCTHWCGPGVMDHWAPRLLELIRGAQTYLKDEPQAQMLAADANGGDESRAGDASTTNACPLDVPADLGLPRNRPRPTDLLPWSLANVSKDAVYTKVSKTGKVATQHLWWPKGPPPAGGWIEAIRASQHPAECQRYMLVEDDMWGSGFGLDVRLLGAALLMAVQQQRVMLHVPGKHHIYKHFPNMTMGRWCNRPPWTYDCMWLPLSHCDPPPRDAVEVTPAGLKRFSYGGKWNFNAPIVRFPLSWLYRSTVVWQHPVCKTDVYAATVEYIFRPRPWVSSIASCIMRRDGLEPRRYVTAFVRRSPEKEKELRKAAKVAASNANSKAGRLPSDADYHFIAQALAKVVGTRAVFVQTANPESLEAFRLFAARHGLTLSHTDNPRSQKDTEGGRFADLSMVHGVVAAVNLVIGQHSGAFLSLRESMWNQLSLTLLSRPATQPLFGGVHDGITLRCNDSFQKLSVRAAVPVGSPPNRSIAQLHDVLLSMAEPESMSQCYFHGYRRAGCEKDRASMCH